MGKFGCSVLETSAYNSHPEDAIVVTRMENLYLCAMIMEYYMLFDNNQKKPESQFKKIYLIKCLHNKSIH